MNVPDVVYYDTSYIISITNCDVTNFVTTIMLSGCLGPNSQAGRTVYDRSRTGSIVTAEEEVKGPKYLYYEGLVLSRSFFNSIQDTVVIYSNILICSIWNVVA